MMRWAPLLLIALAVPAPAPAETLVAARTVRALSILTANDLAVSDMNAVGALEHPDEALGLEARTILYAGRPIQPDDVGTPAIVDRGSMVILVFRRGGLSITAEGRALGRAGPGDQIRVTNPASRTTITGIVQPDGRVAVGSLSGF